MDKEEPGHKTKARAPTISILVSRTGEDASSGEKVRARKNPALPARVGEHVHRDKEGRRSRTRRTTKTSTFTGTVAISVNTIKP